MAVFGKNAMAANTAATLLVKVPVNTLGRVLRYFTAFDSLLNKATNPFLTIEIKFIPGITETIFAVNVVHGVGNEI